MAPDTRRALRTIERAVSAIVGIGILAWIVGLLEAQPDWLGWIATGLLIILGLREFMVGSENVAARVGIKANREGIDAELDSEVVRDGDSVTVVKE